MIPQPKFAKHLLKEIQEIQGNDEYEVLQQIKYETKLSLWLNEQIKNDVKLSNLTTHIPKLTTTLLPILLYKSGFNNLCYFVDDFSKWLYENRKTSISKKQTIAFLEYDVVIFDKNPNDILDIFKDILTDRSIYKSGENEAFYAVYKRALEEYRQNVIYRNEREFVKVTGKKWDKKKNKPIKDWYIENGEEDYISERPFCREKLNIDSANVEAAKKLCNKRLC